MLETRKITFLQSEPFHTSVLHGIQAIFLEIFDWFCEKFTHWTCSPYFSEYTQKLFDN